MIRDKSQSYDAVSAEYYDALRHPTCANFRDASRLILEHFIRPDALMKGWCCEVGAGRSLAGEIIGRCGRQLNNLVITDATMSMLRYSVSFATQGALLLRADATSLPFFDATLSLIVSSLGDPYNVPEFWRELYRVLADDGHVCFTTPSFDWAATFRSMDTEPALESAEFTIANGAKVYLPSFIYEHTRQVDMISQAGFHLLSVMDVTIDQLSPGPISPKLQGVRTLSGSVVTGYMVAKQKPR